MPNQAPSINAAKSTYAITRVSTDAAGTQGNSDSLGPVFSPDGSKIAFSSNASNLVAGTTDGSSYLFLKDLTTGAITVVSVDSLGIQGNVHGFSPVFSPDGSKIAFITTGGLFIKDLTTGATTRVPVDAQSIAGPVFSPDGGKIAFASSNANVGHNSYIGYEIFVKDLTTGAITNVAGAGPVDFGSSMPVFSPDGSKIAFQSDTRLVAGDTFGSFDIFVKDLTTGAVTRVSVDAAGAPGNSNNGSFSPAFSPDGSKIAFYSTASNLVTGDTNNAADIFVKDLTTGAVSRVSVDAAGAQVDSNSSVAVFSPDGSKIAFYSEASNLVPGDANGSFDVFVKDLTTGAVTRVSVDAAGAQGNSNSYTPTVSPDGSRIAFNSDASNLVAGDTNNATDVFVKDLTLGHEDPAVYIENAAAVPVNTQPVTVSDVDNSVFAGGSLAAELTAGSHAGDSLTLIVSGTPGMGIEVSGTSVSYNGTAIGTLSGSGTASLSVALNASADVAAVQALAGVVGFSSGSGGPTADARTVTFTLVDGSGTANGGHDTGSFTQTVLVTAAAVNHAPQISFPNGTNVTTPIPGRVLSASELFTASDLDNDALTYFLYDWSPAANSGHFEVRGVVVPAQTVIGLTAADLALTRFIAGAPGTTDDLGVMAFDGHDYSGNTSFTPFHVNVPANHAPVVTVASPVVSARAGQVFAASSLFSASDADGNPLVYFLYDWSPEPNSGHFVVNGAVVPAQTVIGLTASDLAQTTFVAGALGSIDDLGVMVFDGYDYSGNTSFSPIHVTPVNHAPVVTVPQVNVAAHTGQTLAASSLFSVSDADNDALTYFIYDWNPAPDSGHFVVNGAVQPAQTVIGLTTADLAHTSFVAGSAGATDDLGVMAFDGHDYSGNTSFNPIHVTGGVNHAPAVTVAAVNATASAGEVLAASDLFSLSDADNDALIYFLYDWSPASNSGHFEVNEAVVPAQTVIGLTAADLAHTTFVAGTLGATDDLGVMAFDGFDYSGNTSFNPIHVTAVNHAPVVSIPQVNVAANAGQVFPASSLFSVTDADHDALTYFIYDWSPAANSGHFEVNGAVQPAQTVIGLTASDLAHTSFVAGTAGAVDDLGVMAFDGHDYSSNTSFDGFHILV